MDSLNFLVDIMQKYGGLGALSIVAFIFMRKYGIYIIKGYTDINLWIKQRDDFSTEERQDRKEIIRLLNDISASLKTLATKDDIIQLQSQKINSYMKSSVEKDVINA